MIFEFEWNVIVSVGGQYDYGRETVYERNIQTRLIQLVAGQQINH